MEEIGDEEFYCSLTKKNLQVLCKRHGLSPYMTKPKLANSLYSFFKKKNLSSVSPIESFIVDSVTGVPMEMIHGHALKDSHVKTSYATEKDNKRNDYEAVKSDEEPNHKAPDFQTIQGSPFPDYDRNNSTSTCPDKKTLSMQSAPRCRGTFFNGGIHLASVDSEKNNISFKTETGKNLTTKIPSRNLFHDLKKCSKPFSPLEFHASSGKGINIIVDLDASPSDVCKSLENEVRNCYCVHNSKFKTLREELELLWRKGCSENKFSLWRTGIEKPFDHTQKSHSISCNNMDPDITCQQKKESHSLSRSSMLCDDVVPMTKFEKGHDDDDPAVPETDVFAEERGRSQAISLSIKMSKPQLNMECDYVMNHNSDIYVQEHLNLVGDAETSKKFHPNMPLKEKLIVKVGSKRKRPSSEYNQRLTRSKCLTNRILPRRSLRLVGAQEL